MLEIYHSRFGMQVETAKMAYGLEGAVRLGMCSKSCADSESGESRDRKLSKHENIFDFSMHLHCLRIDGVFPAWLEKSLFVPG